MKQLVRLWKRPSRDGKSYTYVLRYKDESGRPRWESLGHADGRKAESQRALKERELRMGYVAPDSMRLSEFLEDILVRTRQQVTEGTLKEYESTMKQFIGMAGDIDFRTIRHEHGERFIQRCLDDGNSSGTARKKIVTLKRLFNLAIQRGQIEINPLRHVSKPKVAEGEIHVYSDEECQRMVKVARDLKMGKSYRWELLILTTLCTGMRRGELLNTTWRDVDFAGQKIQISPKENTKHTWAWRIKDTDRRRVPLTDEVIQLLAEQQAAQPEGHPYVFVPPRRYDKIQKARLQSQWTIRQGQCPLGNFRSQFLRILAHAGIDQGTFHDLRRTCITNWFAHGLSEFEVMVLAGHSSFETTRKFYLAIRKDIIDRARQASTESLKSISVAHLCAPPFEA
ncbi:MAG: tyrosine-type recombinase/integrase [Planctomycetes bacterium]|nr:tyrosine-type recombinase/integrase [Planctomycetota bacterium]